jgi:ABC-2 type transport system ATP-binding protein
VTPMDPETSGVQVEGLVVSFGRHLAVADLTISVGGGDTVALIGRNGAGKSTTLRVLGGVLPPSAGRVRINGVDAGRDPSSARAQVGYCPDVGGLIPRATIWEHLELSAVMRGLDDDWRSRAHELLTAFDLLGAADRITADFSHGMSRRTGVVLAALHRPAVLLLDEPFDGVDPLGVDATMAVIDDLVAGGSTVIVSTHLLDLAVQCCRRAVVLSGGRAVSDGPADALSGRAGAEVYRSLLA